MEMPDELQLQGELQMGGMCKTPLPLWEVSEKSKWKQDVYSVIGRKRE